MTERTPGDGDADGDAGSDGDAGEHGGDGDRRHEFSAGEGFEAPHEGMDLDPPELAVDPDEVDPVDTRVLTDLLDERHLENEDVDADDLIDVGLSYMGINRHEQAADAFERAARFAGDETAEQEAWVNKGVAHAELEEWDRAVDAYRVALDIEEEAFAADARTNLAYALWQRGETESAYRHAEEAVRADERLPQAWYNLGFMENEQGRHEEAAECLDNAVRLGFRQADVYEEKARALDELGREEEAQAAAEQAEEMRERTEEDLVG
jgi:tetratricopeptide (TPR) repeat protein